MMPSAQPLIETGAPTVDAVVARAVDLFRAAYGAEPAFAGIAPGRVNLIGEHTDYNDGFVLPIAIDRVCVAVGDSARDPWKSRVCSAEVTVPAGGAEGMPLVADFDLRRPLRAGPGGGEGGGGPARTSVLSRGAWGSYIAGTMEHFARLDGGRHRANFDVAVASSVPLGAGLSSSAALEVSVATLLEGLTGGELDALAKVRVCRGAEHEFAGVPCGAMDQAVATLGRAGHALLLDCRTMKAEHVALASESRAVVMVVDTRVRHELAAGEYAARRGACERAARGLGVAALRDADAGLLEARGAGLGEDERSAARHVISENARVLRAARALREWDEVTFGQLMFASHDSLRDDFRVSCTELDAVVETARTQEGVLGARLTGGGFGGCVVMLVRPGAVAGVRGAVEAAYRARFGRECGVFLVRASGGAAGRVV